MMMRRLILLAGTVTAAIVLGLSPLAGAPAPRVVAIGDVHGAAEPFTAILLRAGLIDEEQRWAGGTTVLVQTGDATDRGAKTRQVLDLMMRLESQASKVGGRVHVLAGNHEFMNLLGETRDVTPDIFLSFADEQSEARRQRAFAEAKKLKGPAIGEKDDWMAAHPPGYIEYRAAFAPDGRYGKWLRSKPVAVRVDDSIFMHAGIDPEWPADSIDDINGRARREMRQWDDAVRWMERHDLILPFSTLREMQAAAAREQARLMARSDRDLQTTRALQAVATILNAGATSLLAPNGPLWFRGFHNWSDAEGAPLVAALLRKHNARRFVTGHSVQPDGRIRERFGGGLFLIDTGMVFPKGRASALEIEGGKTAVLYADR